MEEEERISDTGSLAKTNPPTSKPATDSRAARPESRPFATDPPPFDGTTADPLIFKEHLVVLHPVQSHGSVFKLLGCMVDTDLRRQTAVDQLMTKINPKIAAILVTRGYYSVPQFIVQAKIHIWGLMEANMGNVPCFQFFTRYSQEAIRPQIDF